MKKSKRKKKYTKKAVRIYSIITGLLLGIVLYVGYHILENDYQKVVIDEITTNYISFNNSYQTDSLKITNLKPMPERKGESSNNLSKKTFIVNGKKKNRYEIVLYQHGSVIDEKKVNFSLWENKEKVVSGEIINMPEKNDGGKIIYEGVIENPKKFILKMWLDKSYEVSTKNLVYEIKIIPR